MKRTVSGVAAAALGALALAACGSSSPPAPSALDPANMAPASSVAYGSITVRPQGSFDTNLRSIVDELGGSGSFDKLTRSLDNELNKSSKGSVTGLKSWLGQSVGYAIVAPPSGNHGIRQNEVVIIPTNNVRAARAYTSKYASKMAPSAGGTIRIVGHYVLIGARAAVNAAAATTRSTSLASLPAYTSAIAKLPADRLGLAYVRERAVLSALMRPLLNEHIPTASGALQLTAVPGAGAKQLKAEQRAERLASADLRAEQARFKTEVDKLSPNAAGVVALTITANTVGIDLLSSGPQPTASDTTNAPSDVSGLPGDSWLALSLGGSLADPHTVTKLSDMVGALVKQFSLGKSSASGPLRFVANDLIPALGPISVSAAGTSLATLQVGAQITPAVSSTAGRLLNGLKSLVKGLPVPVSVSQQGGKVVVGYGFKNIAQLLSPSSPLSSDATYKQALAQLPSSSQVPFFLNFGPISELASLDHGASDSTALGVLRKLNYVIAGGTHGDFRIVLGIH